MKLLALALIPLAATGAFAGERDRGPGLPGQRQGNALVYAARDFDSVSLGGAARVIVRAGPVFAVRAEGPAEAFANFRVAREGRTLQVGRRYEGRSEMPLERRITVYVTLPALAAASVGGSGSIDADRGGGERFSGAVGGSGRLRVARLDTPTAELSVGGSGDIAAAGTVGALKANVGGSGSIAAPGLRASRAEVSIGGSGSVRAMVAGPADVSIAGSGSVDLGAQARCRVSKVGSGTARCGR
ncbi:DUF2807 domain-containing protein [Sphingomonas sp. RP10(2022)]|uniref:DUF2807 domain-containing protein n=1 Tax=Sphingomonas liriopis TaxID=2949094 RepID=A0A9X2KPP8_9SPHN|nr:head GIN domain-containing protein [Sphingomonas liriopis]MCP3734155.1 DUF2807 domain-containing protein [Sphingomonas liriopis]